MNLPLFIHNEIRNKDSRITVEQTETDGKTWPTAAKPELICMTATLCMSNSVLWDKKLPEKNFTEEEELCSPKGKL